MYKTTCAASELLQIFYFNPLTHMYKTNGSPVESIDIETSIHLHTCIRRNPLQYGGQAQLLQSTYTHV